MKIKSQRKLFNNSMEKFIKTLLILSFVSLGLNLNAQYDINIKVNNYEFDTLIVGYFHGDRQLVKDSLIASKPGKFEFEGKDTLLSGLYILLSPSDNEYMQFHVNEGDTKFNIEYDYKDKTQVKYKGSEYNEVFQAYVELISASRPVATTLRDTIGTLKEQNKDYSSFQKELDELDQKVIEKQDEVIRHDSTSIASLILKSSEEPIVPDFEDAKDPKVARYLYYKEHFFDNANLSNPVMLNTGVLPQKIDTYIQKLTSNHPDSINNSLDVLLNKMEPAEDTYKYYLSTFLNKYAASKVIGYDAIYVHLVDTYYSNGKAPWVSEENIAKIVDNANKLRPALIGKIGSDIKVYKEDGVTPVSISDIDYEYLVLLFWAPDCGHCTKMMPKFVEFNDRWAANGVKTFAICSKHQDKTKTCWENLEKKNMLGFINGADQYHKSRFKFKYNVSSTPKVYILNKDREILMKNIGSDQLDKVMIEILKREKREELIPEAAFLEEIKKKERIEELKEKSYK